MTGLMPRTPRTWQDDPGDGTGSRGRGLTRVAKRLPSRMRIYPEHVLRASGSRGCSLWPFRTQGEREPVTDGGVREPRSTSVLMPQPSRVT